MKRILFSIFLIFFCFTLIQAQDNQTTGDKSEFGFKAGVNLAYQHIEFGPAENTINNTGFYIGSAVNIPLGNNFSVQPEILFSSTNYLDDSGTNNQLHLPILISYEVFEDFKASMGPEIQYVLKLGQTDVEQDYVNRLLLGADLGLGYEFSENFLLETRFHLSLTKTVDLNSTTFRRTNSLQIGLAYFFDKN